MLLPLAASAEVIEKDGIWYNLNSEDNTAEVVASQGAQYSGDISIPSSIYNYKSYIVTSIGESAFEGCTGLTSIIIPSSMKSIEKRAFSCCSGLTSVHISDLATWCEINFYNIDSNPLIYAHHLYIDGIEVTKLVIPDGVTSISNLAFYFCSGLTSVSITDGVTSIGIAAFGDCVGLTSVTISGSVTDFGNSAFQNCNRLTSVTILNGVTSIGNNAFRGCSSLTSVSIPDGVTSIGRSAFSYCSGLTSVNIPSSVTSIGDDAFFMCSRLASVNIPAGVTTIGKGVFCGCSSLTSVSIPDDVTSIGDSAFGSCSSLTSASIPDGVTSIGNSAFEGCSSLTSVSIPDGVTSIGRSAFSYCSGLTSVKVESGNPIYDSRNNCNAIINSDNQLIVGCKNTIIPKSVTSIGDFAFSSCTSLTSITIPDNVIAIGNYAFVYCRGLVYITLPSNLTSIGNYAFNDCINLTYVYCKAENVPSTSSNSFPNPDNISLYVPSSSQTAYQSTEPWSKFKTYYSLSNSDLEATEKCSTPTISIVNGKFVFSCETSGVSYRWSISTPNGFNGKNSVISLPITLNVFATKSGYLNSDVATYEFNGLVGDVDGNGVVNVADHVKLSSIIMEQSE